MADQPTPDARSGGAHVWPVLVGGLVPMTLVAVTRVFVCLSLSPRAGPTQLWRVSREDLAFWTGWVGAWLFGLRLLPPRVSAGLRPLFHTLTLIITVLEMLDLSFAKVTGSRADWDAIRELLGAAEQMLPVVMSEIHAGHLAGALLTLLATLAVTLWRPRPVAWRPTLLATALLFALPIFDAVAPGTRARTPLRTLSNQVFVQLWDDIQNEKNDVEAPPAKETLEPITVRRDAPERPPNVVLVALESTGARHTSLYNPALLTPSPATPTLDRLAAEGLAVRSLYAIVPHTSKAITTLLCGQVARLDYRIVEALPGGMPGRCLPELLGELGYRTAFFQTASGDFEDRHTLVHNMGFDLFRSRETLSSKGFDKVNYFGREDAAMLLPGLDWSSGAAEGAEAIADQPFFATYLTLTSHHDYGVPEDWPPVAVPGLTGDAAKHQDAVRYVDDFLGRLIRGYEERGLADNTLFIVVGDHGEAFGEHGRFQHDLVIYDEGLHVPMVLYGPGVLGGRTGWIEGNRDQTDILPTVLELVGAERTGGWLPGQSLLSDVPADRPLYHSCWRSFRCLAAREGDQKVVDLYQDGPLLRYDLSSDPLEERGEPLPADDPARAALRGWRATVNGRSTALLERWKASVQTDDPRGAIARWEGGMELVTCSTEGKLAVRNQGLWMTCRWRPTEPLAQTWRLRAVLEVGEARWATSVVPLAGQLPTWEWTPGRTVEDTFRLKIPRDVPEGEAVVRVGWTTWSGAAVPGAVGTATLHKIAQVTVVPAVKGAEPDAEEPPDDPSEIPEE